MSRAATGGLGRAALVTGSVASLGFFVARAR